MSHSDFRSTQVGAASLGDLNGSMDAALSPTSLNTSTSTPSQPTASGVLRAEQHSIPPQSTPNGAHVGTQQDAVPGKTVVVDDVQIEQASHALKAMAHPLRLKILCILASSPEVSVQGLVERVGTTQSNISQHLSVLREKQVLDCRKDANKVFYRIRDERFLNVIRSVHDAIH